jgi:hypothetical protein
LNLRVTLAVALLSCLPAVARGGAALRGRVVDAASGEAVAGAVVRVSPQGPEAAGDAGGRFVLAGAAGGPLLLRAEAPGYRARSLWVDPAGWAGELRIELEPEPPHVQEAFTVTAEATAVPGDSPPPLSRLFEGAEVMSLGSVAASDPLRAVQALPGVAANDEYNAGFAARGSGFSAAGLYIDGVRLAAPFHTIRDINDGYSLTIFNGDVVDSVWLSPGVAPARYGDRTGAVLSVRTRAGRADSFHGKASLGAAGAFATLEGPIGKRATWIASARKSYLDYIIDRVEDDPTLALGYRDLTARLTFRPRPSDTLSLLGLLGRARYENTEANPSPHTMVSAEAGTDLAHLSWRHAGGSLSASTALFALRETGDNRDTDGFQRYSLASGQLGVVVDAAWQRGAHRLEGGFEARRWDEDALSQRFDPRPEGPRVLEDYEADGWLWGAWGQGTWALDGGRLSLTLGGRVDRFSATGETTALPRASVDFALAARTRLVAAFGGYAQFPGFEQLEGENGNPDLEAARSRQLVLAVEQRLSGSVRLRVEAYAQSESRLAYNPAIEWRLVNGRVVRPDPDAALRSALSGPSRGVEVTLAAAPAGRVSGFLAYAYAHARREDPDGLRFDSDFDQRHTVTAFLRARAGRSAFFTTALRYGSGFPFPGFLRQAPDGIFLAAERNRFYPRPYARWDVRGEKRFAWSRAALSLYVEVANLLDRDNERYTEISSVNPATGRVRLDRDDMLPLIPLFGASVEF